MDNTTSGIESVNKKVAVSFYPNPTQDILHIDLTDYTDVHDEYYIEIKDINGAQVYFDKMNDGPKNVAIGGLAKGTYIVYIHNSTNVMNGKFVKL